MHAGMRTTRADIETKLARETDVSNWTRAMLKLLVMRVTDRSIQPIYIELFQNGKILGPPAADTIVLARQIASPVVLFFGIAKLANGPGKSFGAIATQMPV